MASNKRGRVEAAKIVQDLRRIIHGLHKGSREIERRTGVTGPQLAALQVVGAGKGPALGDLATQLCLDPGTVSRIMDRLEAARLLSRRGDRGDRRVVRFDLTAKGKALLRRAPPIGENQLVHRLERLSPAERQGIARGMQRIVGLLGAE